MDSKSEKQPELKISEADDAPHRIGDPKLLYKEVGVSPELRCANRVSELLRVIGLPEGLSAAEKYLRLARAIELYEGLDPRDTGEAMLALQMVGTHHAAMECLRRANIPNQTLEGRNMALKQAAQLIALCDKQLRTLQKSKGKGQQKVTVEHVHVEAGGQAIVGNVEAGTSNLPSKGAGPAPHPLDPGSGSQDPVVPAEIEQAADPTMDAPQESRAKSGRRRS